MLFSYRELISRGETQYSIRKKVEAGVLFLAGRGLYSDQNHPILDEGYVSVKYPKAVLTGYSAFYLHDLTDGVPEFYYLATPYNVPAIKDSAIKQTYQDPAALEVGAVYLDTGSGKARVHDPERMLIELFRLRAKWPKDLYFEVLSAYRRRKNELDYGKLERYLGCFKNGRNLFARIREALV